ncbi:MAG: hydroxymethylglutaryl-CoA lyase [Silicimonas sp.]|nr:hydroxymethylglutaryl-CoA lyase [Silicimonas sp.]
MSDDVLIFEMAPRDGLQNEPAAIATEQKIRLVDLLSRAGLQKIEVASFVSPKWVPQMADSAEVMAGIAHRTGTRYTALTPNMTGLQRALAAGADEVAVFGSASESFSQKNINCSIAESLERFSPVVETAIAEGVPVRGYVSCAIACPYEGAIAPMAVADVATALIKLGCYEVSLGDTIGQGTPDTMNRMLDAVLDAVPVDLLAGHYHDTGHRALDNIRVSLERRMRVFDSSAGGLGGCPYAPGAPGNVATEAVVDMLAAEGFETGIDRTALAEAAVFAKGLRNTP